MRPDQFDSLRAIDRVYRDDRRLHAALYREMREKALSTPELAAHLSHVKGNMLGFGDPAFHGAWSLLVDAMPDSFRFLEVGVHKGNILSLVGMLAFQRGKTAAIAGVSPFNGEGGRYGDPPGEDYIAAIRSLEAWCQIPADRGAALIQGRSRDPDAREACRAAGPYDIVCLDGSTEPPIFEADLDAYREFVNPGGYLVVYRASAGLALPPHIWPGPSDFGRAITAVLESDPRFRPIAAIGHMRVWTKRANDRETAAAMAAGEIPVPMRVAPAETRRFGGTPDRAPDLVMTFASNYRFADIEPFVASLLNHGRNIHLTVFAQDMDETFYIIAERLNIEVIDPGPYLSGWHMKNARFKAYQDYLRATAGKWRNVLLSDIRDVLFQDDPFAQPLPAPVVFAAEHAVIGTTGVNHGWLTERYSREIADSLAENRIVCAGTTIGTIGGIIAYVDAIWNEIGSDSYDHYRTFDQGSHNYLVWHLKPDWGLVDQEDRIMATIGMTSPDRIAIANKLIMVDGKVPPIVHQYDRKPGLVAFVGQSKSMHLR